VLIDGEVVLQDGKPTRFDLDAAAAEAAAMLASQPLPSRAADTARRLLPYLESYYAGWDVPDAAPYICYNART
jgi:hypothetical protein